MLSKKFGMFGFDSWGWRTCPKSKDVYISIGVHESLGSKRLSGA
jgi:hypothetical protein